MTLRRVRGALLRLVRRRLLVSLVGAALLALAVWLESGRVDAAAWVEGVGLIAGATGAALLWTGVAGLRPDWTDEN
ncbi:MAG: hypothetical protein ABI868_24210 [Acidobacteriota bacterium]